MNIAVRYQSRNGNTKAAAEAIAEAAGVSALPIAVPMDGYTDILFVGGGVYMWDIDKSLADFLCGLSKDKIGRIAAFSTTGIMTTAVSRICEYAEKAGIPVSRHTLCLKMLARGHSALGLKGGDLTAKQISEAHSFAKKVLADA